MNMYKGFWQNSDNVVLLYLVFRQMDRYVTFTSQAQKEQASFHSLRVVVNTA
ncbi:hypothetical protein NXV03_09570 [Phocaeicola vulgatus]|nr:hypothetical protein [Phocaeicola vulgatus]